MEWEVGGVTPPRLPHPALCVRTPGHSRKLCLGSHMGTEWKQPQVPKLHPPAPQLPLPWGHSRKSPCPSPKPQPLLYHIPAPALLFFMPWPRSWPPYHPGLPSEHSPAFEFCFKSLRCRDWGQRMEPVFELSLLGALNLKIQYLMHGWTVMFYPL